MKENWSNWIKANGNKLSSTQVKNFLDEFCELPSYKVTDLILLLSILRLGDYKTAELGRVISCLKGNLEFFSTLARFDNLFHRFMQVLASMCRAKPDPLAPAHLLTLVMRIEALGVQSHAYQHFLTQSYPRCYQTESKSISQFFKLKLASVMIKHGLLSPQQAQEIYASSNSDPNMDAHLRASLLGLAASGNGAAALVPEIEALVAELKK